MLLELLTVRLRYPYDGTRTTVLYGDGAKPYVCLFQLFHTNTHFFMLKYLLRHDIIIIRQVLGESEVGQLTGNAQQQIGTSRYLPGSLDSITKQS